MGKSSTGKDTIYKYLISKEELGLKILIPYTTRPIRISEVQGREYHFVDEAGYEEIKAQGNIIEERAYDTVYGVWRYFTVMDEEIKSLQDNYLFIGTLEAYVSLCSVIGKENVVPVYIEVDDGDRLARALKRERKQEEPKYAEMCRRFLADSEDFSEEKLADAGITDKARFENENLEECINAVTDYIRKSVDVNN